MRRRHRAGDGSRGLDLDRLCPEAVRGIRILPVVHERIELAAVVRAVLDHLDPAGVAVELPTTLLEAAEAGVRRLPRVSLIVSQEEAEDALVWVVAPGDPFAEALRWARERERRTFAIDPDLPYRERHPDPVPDPYAMWELGAEGYLELLAEQGEAWPRTEADRRRERGMAYHARRAATELGDEALVVLVGAAHARAVAALLAGPLPHPFARVRRASVELRHLHPRSLTALLPDPPLAHAAWERVRDGEAPPAPELGSTLSRRVSLVRFGFRVIAGEGGREEEERRWRRVDYAAAAGTAPGPGGFPAPDRRALEAAVWRMGAGSYREQTGEAVAGWQRRLFREYCRRHARVQGQLAPALFEWVVAARGVGDDNLAWEIFDAARCYPFQEEGAEIPTARIQGSELDLGTRKVRFRRRFFRVKQRPIALPVRERPAPEEPADWLRAFDGSGICSYPPEDLVVEDYGRFLQRRAISVLSAERKRSEPFAASLLDGIDLRETLRHLHEGTVYVEERGRAPGEAGSVVVVFDRDADDERYPFRMTWLGEHDQESDMAFYSTPPAEQVVGPGIMRATYGGFLLSYPPGRLFDVWHDPDYRLAREKREVLLMAGVDYSPEKIVVHLGSDPPSEAIRRYAAAQGKRIVHLPIASVSPLVLKRLRVVHLLAGKEKRAVARDYIW